MAQIGRHNNRLGLRAWLGGSLAQTFFSSARPRLRLGARVSSKPFGF